MIFAQTFLIFALSDFASVLCARKFSFAPQGWTQNCSLFIFIYYYFIIYSLLFLKLWDWLPLFLCVFLFGRRRETSALRACWSLGFSRWGLWIHARAFVRPFVRLCVRACVTQRSQNPFIGIFRNLVQSWGFLMRRKWHFRIFPEKSRLAVFGPFSSKMPFFAINQGFSQFLKI